ncbi:hypothetical protein [Curtobacterium sp. PhB78]|uniref:hypothetical protein n=1 Tax=Curtobacterium sp. PhB78 TaxID=2485102 RepID=UPI0011CD8765|nr:hypothetical protein [Curtobacterium sp. PhB78]
MRTVVLGTVFVVLTMGTLVGCSAREAAQSPTVVPSATSTSSALPVVASTKGLVKLDWSSTSSTAAGSVVVSVQNKDCVAPMGVTVDESTTTVTVQAWGKKQQEPCAAVGYALRGALPLQEPLGDRTLSHG